MKKFLLIFVCLVVAGGGVFAFEPVLMTDLEKPDSLTVDDKHLYITDQAWVFVYSLKDFKLVKRFGKAGEGPAEFRVRKLDRIGLFLYLLDDEIMISSWGRVSYFTKTGDFIRQKNLSFPIQTFKPLGKYYAGYKKIIEDKISYATVLIYDTKTLEPVKEVYRKLWLGRIKNKVELIWLARTFKDPLYRGPMFATGEKKLFVQGIGNEIIVFDENGKKLYTIPDRYEKIPVPDSFKKDTFAYLQKRAPNAYRFAKKDGWFPEHFPIRGFKVADGKLYVSTFKQKDGQCEFYISDLKGNNTIKKFLPFGESEFLVAYPYAIGNKTLYQIIENEDEGEWELRCKKID